ncbi:hypothetical protein A5320_18175 [Rheinheimera sp. SA_1]|uniref:non-ribosomal peptide synthetase n=1 Tax=Rheinheimera sp. SA_1 TaxID=1827365 RepID=UPI00080196BB|nr:non-ribosomal peptide synthetase [Rheinheimera sp. SA_1]OBP13477.1 hypothetical protein A5320_18175 [Rheinheimera sp. SA_1]
MVAELITQLKNAGFELHVEAGKLKVRAQKGAMSAEVSEKIKRYKHELIEFLQLDDNATGPLASAAQYVPWLSYAQQRLWFIDQLGQGSVQYNIPGRLELHIALDIEALRSALATLLQRHEVLRTRFAEIAGEPRQIISNSYDLPLTEHDLSHLPQAEKRLQLRQLVKAEAMTPFDLSADLMLRLRLIRLEQAHYLLLYTQHHIASDGWSMNILQKELTELYHAYAQGKSNPLPPLPIQYADYAKWQLEWLQGDVLQQQLDYWQRQLADLPKVHQLTTDYVRPLQQSFEAGRYRQQLSRDLSAAIRQLCISHEVTLFMFLQTAYALLIARFSNSNDVVVGTPIAGRTHKDVEGLLGFFVNSLVLRTRLPQESDFGALLAANKHMILDAYQHQHVPFEMLVEKLCPERDLAYNPLFQLLFVVQNNEQGLWDKPSRSEMGPQSDELSDSFATTRFDLELHAYETAGQLSFKWVRNVALFSAGSLQRLASAFELLLQSIVTALQHPATAGTRVSGLALLDDGEIANLQHHWQATTQPFLQHSCVHQLFSQQAASTPAQVAVRFGERTFSYAELETTANKLAHALVAQGVRPGDFVALAVERTEWMLVAVLAVLKAGAAYLPLDPDYPPARIQQLLADSAAVVLLKQTGHLNNVTFAQPVLLLEQAIAEAAWPTTTVSQGVGLSADYPAYVIYTSGSTGQPKGVVVSHRNLMNYLCHGLGYLPTHLAGSVVSTALVFDATVCSLWLPLISGKTVELLPQDGSMIEKLVDFLLDDDEAMLFKLTPSHLVAALHSAMLTVNEQARHVLVVGGEQLSGALLSKWTSYFPHCTVINEYGPTEATVGCSTYRYLAATADAEPPAAIATGSVPIGRPIQNMQLYVLSDTLDLLPIGTPGELYIAGAGVTDGYVGRAAATAERFVPNPFARQPSERMYRSGDWVRWRPDGELEFLRRIDEQLKVRGYRIEPAEIAATLSASTLISNAIVDLHQMAEQSPQLVAYVSPSQQWLVQLADNHNQDNISQWTGVFDDTYSDPTTGYLADLNYAGWSSSYTGQTIAADQMDEWLAETLKVIKALNPGNLLEIGCGTGLLLLRYGANCQRVHAVDISAAALMNVKTELQRRNWQHVQLLKGDALCIAHLPSALTFDTVVCNSVAQYFPNVRYFEQMLELALARLDTGGRILLGDIRNLDLFAAHVTAVEYGRLSSAIQLQTLARRVQRRMQQEQELLLSPGYFACLQQRFSGLGRVDILVKRGVAEHEMIRYRYEVVLTKGQPAAEVAFSWFDFAGLQQMRALVEATAERVFGISGIDNPRISADLALHTQLTELSSNLHLQPPDNPGSFSAAAMAQATELELLLQHAEQLGYRVALTWSQQAPGQLDAIFSKDTMPQVQARHRYQNGYLANHPLLGNVAGVYTEQLKSWLGTRLPAYMLPDVFVVLERMPLTINGKIDRKALPVPDEQDLQKASYVAPTDQTQQQLCELWQQVLGLRQVGIHDNFFALGGHSLLAIRLISRIRAEFATEIQLKMLFEAPTVAELAEQIRHRQDEVVLPAIVRVDRAMPLLLSYAQQRLWFIDQLGEGSTEYNMRGKLSLEGDLDLAALQKALSAMLERHEVLRTCFVSEDGEPRQVILTDYPLPLRCYDLSGLNEQAQQQELANHRRQEAGTAFDLRRDLMVRLRLLQFSSCRHILLYTIHHIAGDGWSIEIFQQELALMYRAFAAGEADPLAPLQIQYADYAAWQRQWLQGELLAQQLAFWQQQLAGLPQVHSLPLDKPRPPRQSTVGRGLHHVLDGRLGKALKTICQSRDLTLFMLLQTAYAVLLWRYSNSDDIVMGSPVSGRSHHDIEGLVGFFVNTLVLRNQVSAEQRFSELLAQNKQQILAAYAHQHVPFEMLVDELVQQRDMSYNSLFQLLFDVQPQSGFIFPNAPATEKFRLVEHLGVRFDLAVHVSDYRDGIALRWSYRDTLFEDDTIRRMAQNFEVLLDSIVTVLQDNSGQPEPALYQLNCIDIAERATLLTKWNDTAREAPHRCVHQLFEEQVERTPTAVAVIFAEQRLSYRQLNEQANALAHQLRDLGVGADVLVALCVERSIDLMIALLAILKAGGAYLPVDASYPLARIEYMLNDSGAGVVVTQRSLQKRLPLAGRTLLLLDATDLGSARPRQSSPPENPALTPDNLAYVIYTSGSTGHPKGVMVSHRNVANFLSAVKERFLLDAVVGSIVSSPVAFDATVQSLYLPLLHGLYVELLPEQDDLIANLADYLVDDEVRLLFKITPAHLKGLAQSGLVSPHTGANHVLVVAGEQLTADVLAVWRQELLPNAVFINEYGPTECTVGSCILDTRDWRAPDAISVPIGQPLANYRFYVLDPQMALLPAGAVGELYIGGAGVARGYLGRQDLTADRFVPDCFSSESAARLYRTGDLVRWLPQGNIEFLGRIDHQLKLRGYRIEPGEIETQLKQAAAVHDAVAVTRQLADDVSLVAYVVAKPAEAALASQLKTMLQGQLPAFMVPAVIVILAELPLTPNGKVDRQALPAPDAQHNPADGYVAPRSALEATVAGIWQTVLGLAQVGIHDNFFALGGHSLLATRLISRIRQVFAVELHLRELFEAPTVAELAAQLSFADGRFVLPAIMPVAAGLAPLSYAQQRLWFIDQLAGGGSIQYNMPGRYLLNGHFVPDAFRRAVAAIIERHQVLRTNIVVVDGEARPQLQQQFELPYREHDVSQLDGAQKAKAVEQLIAEEACTAFDLAVDLMLRTRVVRLRDKQHLILFTLHHIASDGWSMGIFSRELTTLYAAFAECAVDPRPALKVQYADYAHWQRHWLQGPVLRQQLNYWQERLAGLPAVHGLQLDKPRPARQSFEGGRFRQLLDAAATARLKVLCEQYQVTPFMLLQSIFAVLLARYSGQTDIVIGTPVSGRSHQDTEDLIGFFVNTLVLRSDLSGNPDFVDVLEQNRRHVLDAYAHQHLPFEMLVEQLNPERALAFNPLFQILFTVQNNEQLSLDLQADGEQEPNFRQVLSNRLNATFTRTRFDLEVQVIELADGLAIRWIYNLALFEIDSMVRLSQSFMQLIHSVMDSLHRDGGRTAVDTLALVAAPAPVAVPPAAGQSLQQLVQLPVLPIVQLRPAQLVAVCLMEPVNAVLALLNAGCGFSYIPADVPALRVAALLAQSGCCLVVVDADTRPLLEQAQRALPTQTLQLLMLQDIGANLSTAGAGLSEVAMQIGADRYSPAALAALVQGFAAIDPQVVQVMFGATATVLAGLHERLGPAEPVTAPVEPCLRHGVQWAPPGAVANFDIAGPALPLHSDGFYRTGLLARQGASGALIWCRPSNGNPQRALYELQNRLQKLPAIRQVQVLRDASAGLVCYYAGDLTEAVLCQSLREQTPVLPLPNLYVHLDQLPLGTYGNVDIAALPQPWRQQQRPLAPRTDIERALLAIWQQVLGIEQIGVKDNIFALGCHSLLATRLVSRIRSTFGKEIALAALFEQPTIAELADHIAATPDIAMLPAVQRVPRDAKLALSYAQQRLWFIDRLGQGGAAYNMAGRMTWRGELIEQAFNAAVTTIFERHEILRTLYLEQDGTPYQQIQPATAALVDFIDLSAWSAAEKTDAVAAQIQAEAQTPFDLSTDLMLRFRVLKLEPQQHLVLYTFHHIAADGWSRMLLQNELSALYLAYSAGHVNPLLDLKVQYADYAAWQRQWLNGELLRRELDYWHCQLDRLPAMHGLPLDKPRPAVAGFTGRKVLLVLDATRTAQLKALATAQEVTLFMLLQSAFAVLLGRFSSETDIVMATPVAGRNHADVEPLLGFFVNTLVLRCNLARADRFVDLLGQNKAMLLAAFAHQHVPFDMLVEQLSPVRQLSHNPLAQILFALQNNELGVADQQLQLNRELVRNQARIEGSPHGIKFDLELNVMEVAGELAFSWGYDTQLFEAAGIVRLADSLVLLLDAVLLDVAAPIYSLPVLTAQQLEQQLLCGNLCVAACPAAGSIHQLVEQHAVNQPAAAALLFEDEAELSYAELNRRANRLAHQLLARGVAAEQPVGICIERGPAMWVAVLAVLKAGGCYLPLDLQYPTERLLFQLTDSNCRLVVCCDGGRARLQADVLPVLARPLLLVDCDTRQQLPEHNPAVPVVPTQLAYLIYTSGSTGRPKGVAVTHGGWVNLACAQVERFAVHAGSRCLQFASISFDAAAFEMSLAFQSGAALCLLSTAQAKSPQAVAEVINRRHLTHATLPPALLPYLDQDSLRLETLIVAGEAVSQPTAVLWSQGRRFINAYGPTETTVCAAAGLYRQGEVSIGTALAHQQCYVLDRYGQLVPTGAVGELYVGGRQLARGYLGQPGLTARQFVPNPFASEPGQRLYATGDLVRQQADGSLLFVGRLDQQVKIRGFRIELAEIEQQLRCQPTVNDCVVITLQFNGQPLLVAYVVRQPDEQTDIRPALADAMAAVLPEYMQPQVYLLLARLPLTANGKLDRAALPAPQPADLRLVAYVAPRNQTEMLLCTLWQQVLGLEQVGIEDNFFSLGGHSLLTTRLANLIRQQFNRDIPLRTLFEQTTIARLSEHIFATTAERQLFEHERRLMRSDILIEDGEL